MDMEKSRGGGNSMNIFHNIIIVSIIFYYLIRLLDIKPGTPRIDRGVLPTTSYINMETTTEGTPRKQVDNDAIAVLVKLGIPKTEATQRVVRVFDGVMGTPDVVKLALRVTL